MPWIYIVITILLIIGAIIASNTFKVQREEFKKTGKHPKGYYLGLGIAIGLPIGIPIGIIVENVSLGPAIGLPIGIIIGSFLERKYANKLRYFTEQEERQQRKLIAFLTFTLFLGILIFIFKVLY